MDKEKLLQRVERYIIEKKKILDNLNETIENVEKNEIKKALHLSNPKKGVLDAIQERLISRKLLVFICATVLLGSAQLDPETWGMIAMIYIGGQTAVDFAKMWRHGG